MNLSRLDLRRFPVPSSHLHRAPKQRLSWLGAALLAASAGPAWGQATFQGLGYLPPGANTKYSATNRISGDSSTIVGLSLSSQGEEAFRWTSQSGISPGV